MIFTALILLHKSGERHLKSEISNLQVEKSVLESRISGLLSTRASEKVGSSRKTKCSALSIPTNVYKESILNSKESIIFRDSLAKNNIIHVLTIS